MRPGRALETAQIIAVAKAVVAARIGTETWIVLLRAERERCAARPAADHLARDLDGRVDIYALGCVACWLLTGELVFSGDTPMAVLMQHAQTPPVPLSARTELRIPSQLDALVMSCLSKDPAGRPQTAKELLRRLTEIDGSSAWTSERARDWWLLHKIA